MKTILSITTKIVLLTGILLQSCTKDQSNEVQTGQVEFKMTDAPLNDANVRGVFVTIADIKVDGESIPNFQRQTINLKDYEDGNMVSLASPVLVARPHTNLVLVLDRDKDANGNFPGCYITTTTDDSKYALRSSYVPSLSLDGNWEVRSNRNTAVILDFDIQKAIVSVEDPSVRYTFAKQENVESSIRILNQRDAGAIEGTFHDQSGLQNGKMWVYAYKSGMFNPHTEAEPTSDDKSTFTHAVTSAEVRINGDVKSFKLDFLEAGDYELYFADYLVDDNGGLIYQGMRESLITSGSSVANTVTVPSGFTASVIVKDVSATEVTSINP